MAQWNKYYRATYKREIIFMMDLLDQCKNKKSDDGWRDYAIKELNSRIDKTIDKMISLC